MEKVQLKLLKPWKIYKAGDVVTVPPGVLPQRMIDNKTAVRYTPRKSIRSKKDGENSDEENGVIS